MIELPPPLVLPERPALIMPAPAIIRPEGWWKANLPGMVPGLGFVPGGALFLSARADGTNDYLSYASDLPDIVDSKTGTVALLCNFEGNDATTARLIQHNAGDFTIEKNASDQIRCFFRDSTNTVIHDTTTTDTITSSGGGGTYTDWVTVVVSWDTAVPIYQVYINGVDATPADTTPTLDALVDWVGSYTWAIGASVSGLDLMQADTAWFLLDDVYYDQTVQATREKFYNSGHLDLGADGTDTGLSAPAMYIARRGGESLADFLINKGTGSLTFTENGAFTDGAAWPI